MVQVPAPTSPTVQDRLLGTLIVIVLRAKNLPNRVRIGKQNPYCTITYGLHKKRTDTIERGGQQPEWDAEFRFEILKEGFGGEEQLTAEQAAVVTHKGGVLPAPPMTPSTSQGSDVSSSSKLEKRASKGTLATPVVSTVNSGRRVLRVACWADDARDPKLIGEGELDIEETIRKGKYDDWVQLERKSRYAGEVYLELTWYSNIASASAELAADYPDPDIAPLTGSVSTMSISRPPLPVPPVSQAPHPPPTGPSTYAQFSGGYSPVSAHGPPIPAAAYEHDGRRMSQPAYPASTYPGGTGQVPFSQAPPTSYAVSQASEFGQYTVQALPPPSSLDPYQSYQAQTPAPGQYPPYIATPAPSNAAFAQAYGQQYATVTGHSPYPVPPVPPIPPTGSPYWQQQQQHSGPGLPSASSYPILATSSSQPSLAAVPPPAPPSVAAYGRSPLPPPPSLGPAQPYNPYPVPPVPPQPPSLHAPPAPPGGVFSPPPPPPSLRNDMSAYAPPEAQYGRADFYAQSPTAASGPPPPQAVPHGSTPGGWARPPLPEPPVSAPLSAGTNPYGHPR
ncbi:hypothetical protein JCM8202v2_004240 [Rhodotorula sphaerocarpa]